MADTYISPVLPAQDASGTPRPLKVDGAGALVTAGGGGAATGPTKIANFAGVLTSGSSKICTPTNGKTLTVYKVAGFVKGLTAGTPIELREGGIRFGVVVPDANGWFMWEWPGTTGTFVGSNDNLSFAFTGTTTDSLVMTYYSEA